jgi:HSP20 family protein
MRDALIHKPRRWAMARFRRDWLTQIDTMQREMERLLDHFAGSKPPIAQFARQVWEPALDVYETDDEIVIIAELAGIEEDDLEIIVDRDKFTIRGERMNIGFGIKRTYYQMEIASGPFERAISLPVAVVTRGIKATYSNGLVEVILPKIKDERTHKVNIKIIEGGIGR